MALGGGFWANPVSPPNHFGPMSVDLLEGSALADAEATGGDTPSTHPVHLTPAGDGSTVKYRTTKSTIFAGSVFKVPVRADGGAAPDPPRPSRPRNQCPTVVSPPLLQPAAR